MASVAADSLFIGVTEFRRDPVVFDRLAGSILPELIAERGRPLAAWSVGCSNGAELYTLACLLAEADALEGAQLVGTDVRSSALSQAASGMMTPACAATVPAPWRERYFSEYHGVLTAGEPLRRCAHWIQHDALREPAPAPGRFDIIMCRNVAIYLEPAAAAGLWQSLGAALLPGGCLVVGRAERPAAPTLLRRAPSLYLQPETCA
jgi:chemotaxis methyl-accepting protein methylase